MIHTLLFDLDGTLLPLNQECFTKQYLSHLLPRFKHLIDPSEFAKKLWAATEEMVQSTDAEHTNEQVFRQAFFSGTSLDEEEVWAILAKFYEGPFGDLAHLTEPTPVAANVVSAAVDKGFEIVLATNPLFPRIAIEHRMRWAGIESYPWKLITTLEEMHFCKPSIQYYEEILHRIDRKPEECMMIGNHPLEDMVAATLGMSTYLVTDHLIENEGSIPDAVTYKGTLRELLDFLIEQKD